MSLKSNVTLDRDEDGTWVVECPAIPGCVSQGQTRDEALANVEDAIRLCLKVRTERGLPLTPETRQVEIAAGMGRHNHPRRACHRVWRARHLTFRCTRHRPPRCRSVVTGLACAGAAKLELGNWGQFTSVQPPLVMLQSHYGHYQH